MTGDGKPMIGRCKEGAPVRSGPETALRCAGNGWRSYALSALLALLVLAGCSIERLPAPANSPPDTRLAVQSDSLREQNYHIILSWWGTDTDGELAGFVYRWSDPWEPAETDSVWDGAPGWVFTKATRDTFDFPVGGVRTEAVFEVAAVDDGGLIDPTPASQRFVLTDSLPTVRWVLTPTVSLAAVAFAWTAEDADGRETIARAVLWLDTQEGEDPAASRIEVTGDTIAVFLPQHFQGRYGRRTAYIQVFDAAEAPSNIDSCSWTVEAPAGEYLLIDNAWPDNGPARSDDEFWRERMSAVVGDSAFHIYDVSREGPFRVREEVEHVLGLFKGVVWYGTTCYSGSAPADQAMREGLEVAEEGIYDYVLSGGGILITGHNLIGTEGGLSQTFWNERFGIDHVYLACIQDEWTSNVTLPRRAILRCGPQTGGVDSLKTKVPVANTDYFRPSDRIDPLFWVEPGTVDTTLFPEHATEPFYVGATAERGAGRMALITTRVTRLQEGGQGTGTPEEALENVLRYLFRL